MRARTIADKVWLPRSEVTISRHAARSTPVLSHSCKSKKQQASCLASGVTESSAASMTVPRASSPTSARATSSGRTQRPSETVASCAPSPSSCHSSTCGPVSLSVARSVSRRGSRARVSRTSCARGAAESAPSSKKRRS